MNALLKNQKQERRSFPFKIAGWAQVALLGWMMAWGDFSSRLEYVAVNQTPWGGSEIEFANGKARQGEMNGSERIKTARIDHSKSIPELSDGVNQDSRKSRGEAFHRKRPQSGGTALREQSSVQPSGSERVNPTQCDGYGALPGTTKPSPLIAGANVASQLGWRGHYIDPTGLYYLGARYYAPDSGTFLSPDPLGHSASMDLYSYCDGDPVNQYDADGRLKTGFNSGLNGNISANAPTSSAFYTGALLGGYASGAGSGLDQAYGHGTIAIGPVISGNIGVQFNASLQVSFSNLNNPANRSVGILISSVPYTGVSSSLGLSFGGLFSRSSASSPEQLNGWSGTAGGSIDAGIAFGYDRGGWGTTDKTAPSIDSYFLGLGAKISPEFVVPVPAEGHVNSTWSYGKSIPLFRGIK